MHLTKSAARTGWCAERCTAVLERDPARRTSDGDETGSPTTKRCAAKWASTGCAPKTSALCSTPKTTRSSCARCQLLRGPVRAARSALLAHLFVDEAQDLSPLELAVLIAQRPPAALGHAGRRHRAAPVPRQRLQRLAQRARPLSALATSRSSRCASRTARPARFLTSRATRWDRSPIPSRRAAPRSGAPVEAPRFPGNGAAVAFLGEALRPLCSRASRAPPWLLLARHPEQADRYYEGLQARRGALRCAACARRTSRSARASR